MKINWLKPLIYLSLGAVLMTISSGCEKKISEEEQEKERIRQLIAADKEYTIKTSVKSDYMDVYYYWNNEVKEKNAALKAYEYSSMEDWFDALLYSPKDRWSWCCDSEYYISSQTGTSSSGSWGVSIGQPTEFYNDFGVYVKYILPSSPFAKYGVTRGAQLRAVAGVEIGDKIDSEAKLDALQNHFYDSPNTFTFRLTNGKDTTFTASFTTITTNYILASKVFTSKDFASLKEPVGYFNYLSFKSNFKDDLKKAFTDFKAAGVKKIIIDLRYNGGGDASISKTLASFLAPKGSAGKVFYTTTHNSLLTSEGWNDTECFGGDSGEDISIGIEDVYFIIGKSSASSSEVVINGLNPLMPGRIHLVGKQSYGKPNGMYVLYYPPLSKHPEYKTGDYSSLKYVYLPICFYEKNSLGEEIPSTAEAGSGFEPEKEVPDDMYHDFGVNEENIRACLTHIATGVYPEVNGKTASQSVKSANAFICKSILPECETNPNYGQMIKEPKIFVE